MERFLSFVVLFAIGFHAAASEPKADEAKKTAINKALETFTGAWEIAATQPAGATKEARKLVFKKDGCYAALDKDGKELWAGTFEIDPTAHPKVWDHRSNDAKKKGADVLGIYELEGDKMEMACVVGAWKEGNWTGKPRPTQFKLSNADVLLELRRAKSAKGRPAPRSQ